MAFLTPEALRDQVQSVVSKLCGGGVVRIAAMAGGASLRRYYRVEIEGGKPGSLVVMETGDPRHSDEVVKGGGPDELPFLNVQRYLARGGVAVPALYLYDPDQGLVYLEDLGDITFESRVQPGSDAVRRRYYQLAIDELVGMQRFATAQPDPGCIAFSRGFDFDLLKWELDHFREYGLEARGIVLAPAERQELERQFQQIAERLAAAPRLLVHRDYQSRNLMVQDRGPNEAPRLRVIDFQDALLGTAAYDLVGLLRDSYVALAPQLLDELVGYHVRRAELDERAFRELFDLQTVQRKLKDAGRFVFLEQVKKLPGFMQHIPSSLGYVAEALSRLPELASLREILAGHLNDFPT
jgi:hypothetical protein